RNVSSLLLFVRHMRPTSLLACVTHAPDSLITVVGDVERPVLPYRNTHRPAPRISFRRHEPGNKIFVDSARVPVLERYANHFVSSANCSIPRAMLGREQITAVFLRKLTAVVECQPQRCVVGLQQN